MSQPPYDFNSQSGEDYLFQRRRSPLDDDLPDEILIDPDLQKRAIATSNTLRRSFLMLLAFGLGLGLIVGAGLVVVLNRFGLTEKPNDTQNLPTLQDLPQYRND